MPKIAKIALMTLGVFTLLLGGFYAFLRWDNYSALRSLIASRVERATGQQLTFNGPVSLEMGADSFLNFRDVVLTNPDWQLIRSTITVDEGRIGLDVPNVIAGGIGTIVQLNTVRVELDRPADAAPLPEAPPPGALFAPPADPPLPKFDELRAKRLIVVAENILGGRVLDVKELTVAPESEERTRVEAIAAGASDITLSILTDEIETGRAWSMALVSPRSDLRLVVEATSGRKLKLRALANGPQLHLADVAALLPADRAEAAAARAKPFFAPDAALPVGWLQLIKANLDVSIATVTGADVTVQDVRLEGRANDGWISIAPIEMSAGAGGLRGFAVLDATSLPVKSDVSLALDRFAPMTQAAAVFDGHVRLAGRARTAGDVKTPSGSIKLFARNAPLAIMDSVPLMRDVFRYLMPSEYGPDLTDREASCAILTAAVVDGQDEGVNGQLYADVGRVAMKGRLGLSGAPMDMEVAVDPYDGPVTYLNAVGALARPAVAEDTRHTPWLTTTSPMDQTCAILRQQFDVALSGR